VKRLFDLILSLAGLVLLFPVLLFFAGLVKWEDGGPVFYRGERVGRHGKPFHICKFRTMVVSAEQFGASSTTDDDPRITRIGRFLRRYKLDELPQLMNVVRGQMSMMGPRPQVQWAVDLYTEGERALLSMRPGMTDYASLVFRDEGAILRGSTDPDNEYLLKIHPEKVRLGLAYISQSCLWTDIKIIVATVGAVLGFDPNWCLPASERASLKRHQSALSN